MALRFGYPSTIMQVSFQDVVLGLAQIQHKARFGGLLCFWCCYNYATTCGASACVTRKDDMKYHPSQLDQRFFSEDIGTLREHKPHTLADGPITDESLDAAAKLAYGYIGDKAAEAILKMGER